jgi:hypothetical protein
VLLWSPCPAWAGGRDKSVRAGPDADDAVLLLLALVLLLLLLLLLGSTYGALYCAGAC